MTSAQRTKINRQNASKSSGPKTQAGKDRARRNAFKHGLCASKLALPGEEPGTLKIQCEEWIDTLQPQSPAEVSLVDEAVRADLRLKRCAQAEQARLEWEIVSTPMRWTEAREDRLVELTALLTTDPATAARDLKRFGHGCRWLLERWRALEHAIEHGGRFLGAEQVIDAVHLLGGDIKQPRTGPMLGYSFRFWNAALAPEAMAALLAWLRDDAQRHDHHRYLYGDAVPPSEQARASSWTWLRGRSAALEWRLADHDAHEAAERRAAVAEAALPPDTPKTRLYLRYHASAISSLHRALNSLLRLQKDRHAAEAEAEARNEADGGDEAQLNDDATTDCVEEKESGDGEDGCRVTGEDTMQNIGDDLASLDEIPVVPVVPPLTPLGDSA